MEIGAKLCFLLSWKFLRQEFPTAKGGAIGGRGFTFVAGRHGLIGPGATEACHWTTPREHVQCRGFPADKLCFCTFEHLFTGSVLLLSGSSFFAGNDTLPSQNQLINTLRSSPPSPCFRTAVVPNSTPTARCRRCLKLATWHVREVYHNSRPEPNCLSHCP